MLIRSAAFLQIKLSLSWFKNVLLTKVYLILSGLAFFGIYYEEKVNFTTWVCNLPMTFICQLDWFEMKSYCLATLGWGSLAPTTAWSRRFCFQVSEKITDPVGPVHITFYTVYIPTYFPDFIHVFNAVTATMLALNGDSLCRPRVIARACPCPMPSTQKALLTYVMSMRTRYRSFQSNFFIHRVCSRRASKIL